MPTIVMTSPGHMRQVADAIVDRAIEAQTAERLLNNRKATGAIEYKERTHREEIIAAFYEYFEMLRGRIDLLAERWQHQQPVHARAGAGHIISQADSRALESARRDRDDDRRWREEGNLGVEEDRERNKGDMKRREDAHRRLREDMVGFRAAGVFLVAEETRQRSYLDADYGNQLIAMRKRFAEEEVMAAQRVADREGREDRARQDTINAAKKEAAALDEKRMAEVQRRQNKLISKCTHARNGQSVFIGAYPKKHCLACGIKFDPLTGLYFQMEGKEKATASPKKK